MSKYLIKVIQTGTAINPLVKRLIDLTGLSETEIKKVFDSEEKTFNYDESYGNLMPIGAVKYILEDVGASIKIQDV